MPRSKVVRWPGTSVDKSVEMVENPRFDAGLAGYRLGIFAKQPVPGQVKTRLTPPLSAAEAAELYTVSLRETLDRCQSAGLAPVLFYAGDQEYFQATFTGVDLLPQVGDDLGRRMHNALGHLLAPVSCRGAALIGSDSPDLPLGVLSRAFSALATHDCVVAPAADGGYVLIAMRRLCGELFEQVPWSSAEVLEVTRRRAGQAEVSYHEIPGWEDVDDLPSLHRLLKRSPCSRTARFAARRLARLFPTQT